MSYLANFFMKGHCIHVPKGDVVLRGDDEDAEVFYIDKGFIKVNSINDEGEEYIHVIYKEGDVFPLIWVLRNRPRRVFYEALTSAVLWKISKAEFLEHIESHSDRVTFSLLQQLAEQFNIYADRLDNLQYRNADERIVYRLLFLASRFGEETNDGIVINAPFTHKTIAKSVNLSRESVSREIEKLTKVGILGVVGGKIVIRDLAKLSQQFSEPVSLDLWGLKSSKL